MQLSSQDLVTLYRPSLCSARIYLRAHQVPEAEPTAWDKVLRELGERLEATHLTKFPIHADMRSGSIDTRVAATQQAVQSQQPVIYQGVLRAPFPGAPGDVVVGIPDFLIAQGSGYIIRDCKLSRHVGEDHHPEILRQLELYGWLFQTTFGMAPVALEVVLGDGSIVDLVVNTGQHAIDDLQQIRQIALQQEASYTPVGWSKCQGCSFHNFCWGAAKASQDVAVLPDLDQSAAVALHDQGITNISDLLAHHDETSLAAVPRPWGSRMQRIGNRATTVLQQARALQDNAVLQIAPLALDLGPNVVMFDFEGMPPYLDETEKIYLWGLRVYGDLPSDYLAAVSDFGDDGDRNGWMSFLANCQQVFNDYGDIKFVHWHYYEQTNLKRYLDRYEDTNGIGQRVLNSCFDLYRAVKKSLIFPLPSYSLKVIEQYIGYQRTRKDFGGEWSMAQYVKAVETEDPELRDRLMADIQQYNREDLEATWAVLQWLKRWQ